MTAHILARSFATLALFAFVVTGSVVPTSYCPGDGDKPQEPTSYFCPGDGEKPTEPTS